MLKIKWKGQVDMSRNVRNLAKKFPKTTRAALNRQAEFIMTKAKRLTPVKDGHLRASGQVLLDENPEKFRVTLGFGGPAGIGNQGTNTNRKAVGYALIQHEALEFKHTVGQAKFLERPLLEAIPKIAKKIAEDVGRALGF